MARDLSEKTTEDYELADYAVDTYNISLIRDGYTAWINKDAELRRAGNEIIKRGGVSAKQIIKDEGPVHGKTHILYDIKIFIDRKTTRPLAEGEAFKIAENITGRLIEEISVAR